MVTRLASRRRAAVVGAAPVGRIAQYYAEGLAGRRWGEGVAAPQLQPLGTAELNARLVEHIIALKAGMLPSGSMTKKSVTATAAMSGQFINY